MLSHDRNDDLNVIPSAALQVACAVVAVMEDDVAFNAGYGLCQMRNVILKWMPQLYMEKIVHSVQWQC